MQRGGRARKWERWVVLGRTRLPRPWPWSGSGGARGRHIQRLCVGDSWQTSADGIDVGLGPVTLYRVVETLWLVQACTLGAGDRASIWLSKSGAIGVI